RQADREPRQQYGQDQADRDDVQRSRPERPARDVGQDAQRKRRTTASGHTGTGVFSIASRMSASAERPAERASGETMSRCASTGSAIAFTSSGETKERPDTSARAFATRSSAIPARGLAPRYSRWSARVWRSTATTYRLTLSSTYTAFASSAAASTSAAVQTGSRKSWGGSDVCWASIRASSARGGYPSESRIVNRSSCAS